MVSGKVEGDAGLVALFASSIMQINAVVCIPICHSF